MTVILTSIKLVSFLFKQPQEKGSPKKLVLIFLTGIRLEPFKACRFVACRSVCKRLLWPASSCIVLRPVMTAVGICGKQQPSGAGNVASQKTDLYQCQQRNSGPQVDSNLALSTPETSPLHWQKFFDHTVNAAVFSFFQMLCMYGIWCTY